MEEIVADAKNKYDYIKFVVADINGISRSKLVTKYALEEHLRNGTPCCAIGIGCGCDGRYVHYDIPHLADKNDGNATWMPQLDTLNKLPGVSSDPYRIGVVYCEVMYNSPEGPVSQPSCPRYMARNQLQILRSMGYELYSAFENEPLLIDAETREPAIVKLKSPYLDDVGFYKSQDMLMSILQRSYERGVKLEACHLENSPGQIEFITIPLTGIQSADNVFAFKETIRNVSIEHRKHTTFMTRPFLNYPTANGLHFNHSLRCSEKGTPVCYDNSKINNLADVTLHWLSGILKHIPALTALCCPTVNCYRRFNTAFAPYRNSWGIDDRSSTIRVKNTSPEGCYLELRLPSSAANPYVLVAATVAAGIDGINNKYQCPPTRSDGGVGENLPATLDEALDALKEDTVLTEALGEEFITWFTLMKKAEIERFGGSDVSDDSDDRMNKERELYIEL